MKIQCEREKLLHAFQTAASVAPTRSPKPILQNLKLEVASEHAVLMGTDLEVGIRIDVPGIVIEAAGNAILPISRFLSILRESSDEKLERAKRRPEDHRPRAVERVPSAVGKSR